MFLWLLIFAISFGSNVFASVYPVCTGYNFSIKHYRSQAYTDLVHSYNFQVKINLNKTYTDKNEIIISNYTSWSFNDAVYYRIKSSYLCKLDNPFDTPAVQSCIEWIPSTVSFIQELPFQSYKLYNYVKIDNNIRIDNLEYIFDKNYMGFQGHDIPLDRGDCIDIMSGSRGVYQYKVCCNNYLSTNIPDKYDSTCLEYKTTASVSLNSSNLLNFEANYVSVPNQLKVSGNQMTTSFYTGYQFYVYGSEDDAVITDCNNGRSSSTSCYLNITRKSYAYNFVVQPRKYQNASDNFVTYGIIVSKLRVVNTVPLKENFQAFTKADPCWKPPNSIPFANGSMTANISFCCTTFGPVLPNPSAYTTAAGTTFGFNFGSSTTKKHSSSDNDGDNSASAYVGLSSLFLVIVGTFFF